MNFSKPRPGTGTTTNLNQLIADQWEAWMRWDPLFATSCGDQRFNERLPDAGEQHYTFWRGQLAGFHQRLQEIDRLALPPADRLNYDIFARMLDFEIAGLDHHGYRLPLSKSGGFHTSSPTCTCTPRSGCSATTRITLPGWQGCAAISKRA